jgi:DNA-binding transcriptional MocR family regulator
LKRRAPLPSISLDRASREPLHRQLTAALRRAIDTGRLPAGAPLPSTRSLADSLGLSRNTVVTAYDELAAEGLLTTRAGAATRVFGNASVPRLPGWLGILRESQYPIDPLSFRDPDGNALYFHR